MQYVTLVETDRGVSLLFCTTASHIQILQIHRSRAEVTRGATLYRDHRYTQAATKKHPRHSLMLVPSCCCSCSFNQQPVQSTPPPSDCSSSQSDISTTQQSRIVVLVKAIQTLFYDATTLRYCDAKASFIHIAIRRPLPTFTYAALTYKSQNLLIGRQQTHTHTHCVVCPRSTVRQRFPSFLDVRKNKENEQLAGWLSTLKSIQDAVDNDGTAAV